MQYSRVCKLNGCVCTKIRFSSSRLIDHQVVVVDLPWCTAGLGVVVVVVAVAEVAEVLLLAGTMPGRTFAFTTVTLIRFEVGKKQKPTKMSPFT